MKRIIVSVWAGFIVYALVIYVAGPAGLPAMARLERERGRMSANVEELKRINAELAEQFMSLRTMDGRLALEARDLGYVRDGETIVRLEGLKPPSRKAYVAGTVLRFDSTNRPDAALPAIAGILAGLFVFIIVSIGGERTSSVRLKV